MGSEREEGWSTEPENLAILSDLISDGIAEAEQVFQKGLKAGAPKAKGIGATALRHGLSGVWLEPYFEFLNAVVVPLHAWLKMSVPSSPEFQFADGADGRFKDEPATLLSLASYNAFSSIESSLIDSRIRSEEPGLVSLKETLECRLREVATEAANMFPAFEPKHIAQRISAPVKFIVIQRLLYHISSILFPSRSPSPVPSTEDVICSVDEHLQTKWIDRAIALRSEIKDRRKPHVSNKRFEWYSLLLKSGLNRGAGQISDQIPVNSTMEKIDSIVSIAELACTATDVIENICSTAFGLVWFTLENKNERSALLQICDIAKYRSKLIKTEVISGSSGVNLGCNLGQVPTLWGPDVTHVTHRHRSHSHKYHWGLYVEADIAPQYHDIMVYWRIYVDYRRI
ncbi:hypothetical protein SISNIDRAFT_464610 [Sistotremastrum niveocremeum HHB9708]|uniref:Uncharacterized protein n=1 Tax=Sistotremastrum niveocremeum HHB9708 TaxID=1314777 RepID=A0A164X419_9AGAM|nr:hypothetical protein SISNIDRAFT_464610 [Sistotremastrum niveocremeum HHB9708]